MVVIATGPSSGIGWATAILLTPKGAWVALISCSRDTLLKLSRDLPDSFAATADLSREYVADIVLDAIQTGKAELFAHEWMIKRR